MNLSLFKEKNAKTLTGFLKITRVHNLIYIAVTQYLVAVFLSNDPVNWRETVLDPFLLLIIVSTNLIAAAGYIINDYYDVKIDYINRPDKVVVGRYLKRRMAIAAHSVLNFAGIGLGFLVHWKIGLLNFTCAFFLWLYSNHLKRFPLIGNITIGLLTSAALLVIAFYFQSNKDLIYMYALFAFSISFIREIIKDMEDLKGDMNFGSKTLPIIWGIRRTKFFIYIISGFFITGYVFYIVSLSHPVLTTYFILLIIPVVYFFHKLHIADTKKEYSYLTNYCKLLMFSGVLSMIFY